MEYKLTINGMKCEGCVNRINNVLSTIKGVESFNVSLETKTLTIKVKKENILKRCNSCSIHAYTCSSRGRPYNFCVVGCLIVCLFYFYSFILLFF